MTVSERARRSLYESLEKALGKEPADTVMTYLPPVGFAEVATKADLMHLRETLDLRMDTLASGLRAEMADLRTELRTGMADLRTEMADLRTELTAAIHQQGEVFARAQARQTQVFIAWNGTFLIAIVAALYGSQLLG